MALYMRTNGVTKKVGTSSPSAIPASNSTYDNTQSGLSADNVQNAIDEINSNLPKIEDITSNVIPTGSTGTIDYPTGYDQNNCILIGAYYTSGSGAHATSTDYVVYLTSGTQIQISNNTGVSRTFHVQLMKLPS